MPSVAEFLLERLENAGVKHVFGVTGEYVSPFLKRIERSESMELISTVDELAAGFAADAYARIKGAGCVCATYNVGALKLINAVAGAYAERSPLIVISGAPGAKEHVEDNLLTHMVRSYGCQKSIFKNITCASAVLDNASTAGYEIDRVLEALAYYKQPIYIELPRDIADSPIAYDVYKQGTPQSPKSDKPNLEEALEEVVSWLTVAKKPVILVGVEAARFDLGNQLMRFAEKTNIPLAATLLSKSVISENHPMYLGVYSGVTSQKGVQQAVEDSDCLLMLGVVVGDMTLNSLPSKFSKRNVIACTIEEMHIKNHLYKQVQFRDLVERILKAEIPKKSEAIVSTIQKKPSIFTPQAGVSINVARLFEKINSILTPEMTVVSDVGDALYGSSELMIHAKNGFLGSALYGSMGTAIPGALGANIADEQTRPIVIVGDGAFQMSLAELSTIVSRRLKPIVFVLNNGGYSTEKTNVDGEFNNILNWNYDKIVDVIGGGTGIHVDTEGELEDALSYALKSNTLTVINVSLDSRDRSETFNKMRSGIRK